MMRKAISLISLVAACLGHGTMHEKLNVPCGEPGTLYRTDDTMLLCVYFPDLEQKIVFTPKVDRWQAFQMKGLYEVFEEVRQDDVLAYVIVDGIQSNPVVVKRSNVVVMVLQIKIILEQGRVVSLQWANSCSSVSAINTKVVMDMWEH